MDNDKKYNSGLAPFFAGLIYGLLIGILLMLFTEDRKINKEFEQHNRDWSELMRRVSDSYKLDYPQPDTVTIVRLDTLFIELNK